MSRKETWLTAIGLALGVLFAAGLGLYSFLNMAATPLHSNPQDVPSVTHATPSQEWIGAVEQGRELAREGLVEKNLPGLSVAVGIAGEVVWAEGFGWADVEKRVPVTPVRTSGSGTRPKRSPRRRWACPGERPDPARQRDSDLRSRISQEAVANHAPTADGPHGRRQTLPQ